MGGLSAGDEGWQVIGLALRLDPGLWRPERLMLRRLRLLVRLSLAWKIRLWFTGPVPRLPKGVHPWLPVVVPSSKGSSRGPENSPSGRGKVAIAAGTAPAPPR